MPSNEPTLQERRDRVRQDFLSRMGAGDAPLRRSVENVYSYVIAGAAHSLGGFISWVLKQIIPSEDSDLDSILRWAINLLEVPQVAGTPARGTVTFTGTNGAPVPAGHTVTNRDGISFTVDNPLTIVAGTISGPVTAIEAGPNGNTEAGVIVFLGSPAPGIDDQGTVATGGLTGGAEDEDKFGVLERLRTRFQNPPRGGGTGDYVSWAKEVAGVDRAFEFPRTPTTGWMTVVVVDDTSGPVPGASTITDAQANVDAKRPAIMGGAKVIGPVPQHLNLEWTNLVSTDPVAAQAALEANVESWVLANGEPGLILSQPEIENAAQAATGVQSVSLTVPSSDANPGTFGMFTTFTHTYA